MGNAIEKLMGYVLNRRRNGNTSSSSFTNHPEQHAPDGSPSTTVTPSNNCSDFYLACRGNDINKVNELLETMTLDEIDKIEPNGSTALHVASYHGHAEIVKLLLEVGADRARINIHQCLPLDEAKNDEIRRLFFRVPNANRLASDTGIIEWELINNRVSATAREERHNIKSVYDSTDIEKMFERIEMDYIGQDLTNFDGIEKIRRFFQKATEEQDPKWIITAYTAETDFYKILNKEIACGATQNQQERKYIIALLWHHHKLDKFAYFGPCYRVVQINHSELKKYQVNCSLMVKSFSSSSIDRKVAECFLCHKEEATDQNRMLARTKADGTLIKSWVMCVYHIKYRRTALHIENLSQYAIEGQILIMPYTVFNVKRISQIKPSFLPKGRTMMEIELEEHND